VKILSINNTPKVNLVKEAILSLSKGNLIIYPTETCYGIGADATNAKAVDKVLEFKGFRKGKPISVAVADKKMATAYTRINPSAENILTNLLPGPITVVCEGKHKVDLRLESETGTLGLRIPDYPLVLGIIEKFGKPITATSANPSGANNPYSIADAIKLLSPKKMKLVDLVLNAGELPVNPPSVVVDTTQDQPEILRKGKIDFSKLNAKTIISASPKETKALAMYLLERNWDLLKDKCLIFALQGDLGTGKTQFAKGIGSFIGIDKITSPTFTIVHEYPFNLREVRGTFYHIDVWRAQGDKEIRNLGLSRIIKPGNIIAIEWIQKSKGVLEDSIIGKPANIIWLELNHLSAQEGRSEKYRRIRFS